MDAYIYIYTHTHKLTCTNGAMSEVCVAAAQGGGTAALVAGLARLQALVLVGFQQPSGYATVSMLGYSRTLGVDDLSSLDFNSDVERESHLILRTQQANGLGLLEPVCRSWAASFNHASKHIEIMIQPQACWKGNGISNKWNSIRQDLAYTA